MDGCDDDGGSKMDGDLHLHTCPTNISTLGCGDCSAATSIELCIAKITVDPGMNFKETKRKNLDRVQNTCSQIYRAKVDPNCFF